jgi:hypothetical protein
MASDCDEDPNESFSDEIVEVIRKQFPLPLYPRSERSIKSNLQNQIR